MFPEDDVGPAKELAIAQTNCDSSEHTTEEKAKADADIEAAKQNLDCLCEALSKSSLAFPMESFVLELQEEAAAALNAINDLAFVVELRTYATKMSEAICEFKPNENDLQKMVELSMKATVGMHFVSTQCQNTLMDLFAVGCEWNKDRMADDTDSLLLWKLVNEVLMNTLSQFLDSASKAQLEWEQAGASIKLQFFMLALQIGTKELQEIECIADLEWKDKAAKWLRCIAATEAALTDCKLPPEGEKDCHM